MEQQKIIDSIHKATMEMFSTMLSLDVTPDAFKKATACPSVQDGVMSFVSLDGPWVGTGVITCSSAVACRFSAAFLMMPDIPVMNEEVLDCIGELTNMVIGNFKTDAEVLLGPLTLGVPTVIYGKNFVSRSMGGNDWLVMPFHCDEDNFEIHICLRPATEGASTRRHASLMEV